MSVAKIKDPTTGEWKPVAMGVGATFTPSVSEEGDLSWSNNLGLANPQTVNIKGAKGDKGDKGDAFTYEDFTEEQLAGLRGADGHTPVRGTDYWTDEDVSAIETYCKNYIDTELLGGAS